MKNATIDIKESEKIDKKIRYRLGYIDKKKDKRYHGDILYPEPSRLILMCETGNNIQNSKECFIELLENGKVIKEYFPDENGHFNIDGITINDPIFRNAIDRLKQS